MRFNIGDTVWVASYDTEVRTEECPDCGGTGRLRVTFHDETTVSIGCAHCSVGYENPTGRVRRLVGLPKTMAVVISGYRIEDGEAWWKVGGPHVWHCYPDDDVFANKEVAEARAAIKAAEVEMQEKRKLELREKPSRTWAWNAFYHRNEIKRLEKELERHKAKLAVADLKKKEEKVQ